VAGNRQETQDVDNRVEIVENLPNRAA
jgi:hypothetical protein